MILVATPDKPFTYNLKGYPRRKTLEKLYSEEIDELYAEIESSAQSDIPSPSTWDAESIRHFLRAVVESTLHQPLDDEEDFFRHGCDRYCFPQIVQLPLLMTVGTACKQRGSATPSFVLFITPTSAPLNACPWILCTKHRPSQL